MTTRLYINSTQIDLYDDGASIALTYSISDIKDIDSRKGATSKTIAVPLTAANMNTLQFPDDISASSLDQNTVHTARVEVDGVDIFRGVAKILSVTDEPPVRECEIVLLGDNGEWKVKIEDLQLAELDLSDSDHVCNTSTIAGTWNNPASYDYAYPVVDYGGLINKTSVEVEDIRPAIKARRLFKDILEGQGYSMSSSFINGTFFGNVYFIGGTAGALPATWRTNRLFRSGISGNYDKVVGSGVTIADTYLDLVDVASAGYYNDTLSNYNEHQDIMSSTRQASRSSR